MNRLEHIVKRTLSNSPATRHKHSSPALSTKSNQMGTEFVTSSRQRPLSSPNDLFLDSLNSFETTNSGKIEVTKTQTAIDGNNSFFKAALSILIWVIIGYTKSWLSEYIQRSFQFFGTPLSNFSQEESLVFGISFSSFLFLPQLLLGKDSWSTLS
ncbi:unnamed protein product [Ambrosiozyma monospora]|uniref:Unnamed protein product n=1 Tax=Ambrosiozyma monospora TaxID=43982 RepID=A0ACB5TIR4_AMBMO|nr:unnamed protein product [Ambrosiozyma monospora]